MITRDDIKKFLIGRKNYAKDKIVSDFTVYVLAEGESIDKLAKLIADLKSYPEWKWGE